MSEDTSLLRGKFRPAGERLGREFDADHPIQWDVVESTVAEAKRWTETPQPEGAALPSHFGPGNYCGGGWYIGFSPSKGRGARGSEAVRNTIHHDKKDMSKVEGHATLTVIVEIIEQYEHDGLDEDGRYINYRCVWEPYLIRQEDFDRFRSILMENFGEIHSEWNGVGCQSASFIVTCGDGVMDAAANYNAHFMPDYDPSGVERYVAPNFVWAIETHAEVGGMSLPSSNAEVVAQTLEAVRPLLVEMGFHDALIQPSSAGEIEGEAPNREFSPDLKLRLGIQLPAESFAELVRLATIGYQFDGDET